MPTIATPSYEDPAHSGEPWRREIMRLTQLIAGKTILGGAVESGASEW
jgi:hypothetical protein